jgi:hypothetical protein
MAEESSAPRKIIGGAFVSLDGETSGSPNA